MPKTLGGFFYLSAGVLVTTYLATSSVRTAVLCFLFQARLSGKPLIMLGATKSEDLNLIIRQR